MHQHVSLRKSGRMLIHAHHPNNQVRKGFNLRTNRPHSYRLINKLVHGQPAALAQALAIRQQVNIRTAGRASTGPGH